MSSPRWLWDSCGGPITWKFNPASAPNGGLEQVAGSFDRVHAATGLDFTYAGTTDVTPRPSDPGTSGADIVVGWIGGQTFAERHGSAVGVGGAAYWRDQRLSNGTRVNRAFEGGVVLNAGYNDRLGNGFGSGTTWGDVLMHEIGHVIGLGHVGSEKQMMFGRITARAARMGRRRPQRIPQDRRHHGLRHRGQPAQPRRAGSRRRRALSGSHGPDARAGGRTWTHQQPDPWAGPGCTRVDVRPPRREATEGQTVVCLRLPRTPSAVPMSSTAAMTARTKPRKSSSQMEPVPRR